MVTIKEAISRLFYDYTIDPAYAEIIIDLRDRFLRIPANFVKFEEDKMYVDGTLLPQNKIVAIIYQNEYWLRRPMKKKPIEYYKPRIPLDLPIRLWLYYPEFFLLRFAYIIINQVEKKLQENLNEEWFEVLGDFEEVVINGEKFWIIRKGVFTNTLFVHSTRTIIRASPNPISFRVIKDELQFQRITIYPELTPVKSYFAVGRKAFVLDEGKIEKTEIPGFWRDFLLMYSISLVQKGIKWYLLAASSNITKRFLLKKEEQSLALQLGIPALKPKEDGLTVREIYEEDKNNIIKIYDFDVIFCKTNNDLSF